jgi:eukaryotic-like serine/threonine-protein kinase
MYYIDQAVDLAAQSVAAEDPTLRDALAPEDMPTILREPLEPAADHGGGSPRGDRTPQPAGGGKPTLKLPIASPPVDLAQQAALARGSGRSPTVGTRGRIGKYEVRERLGKGAFGVVYTARDPSLDRDVAIKVLRPNHLRNPTTVQRFLQEARATARIAHPGIVTIHDCGQVETKAGPTAFIAMELLFGESLTSRLGRCGRLPADHAGEIVRQVASALDAAHRCDVLHRDLKPDNIHLVPDPAIPSGERVKVLDFGLAKLATGSDGLTNVETVFGTPHYMSPEQCRSATQVDHRSDIYSLGCILFELVTGRVPFEGEVRELIEFHQYAAPPLASSLAPDVPPALDALIAEMLAKDPMHRPQTMGAVRRSLQTGESGPQRAPSAPPVLESARHGEIPGSGRHAELPASARHPEPPSARHGEIPGSGGHGAIAGFARAPEPPSAAPAFELEGGMSGELLVPPSGPRPAVAGSKPKSRPKAPAARWQQLSARAKLVGFTVTVAVLSGVIAWACT